MKLTDQRINELCKIHFGRAATYRERAMLVSLVEDIAKESQINVDVEQLKEQGVAWDTVFAALKNCVDEHDVMQRKTGIDTALAIVQYLKDRTVDGQRLFNGILDLCNSIDDPKYVEPTNGASAVLYLTRHIRNLTTQAEKPKLGDRPITDAIINEITSDDLSGWPSFDAQSHACKVVHAVLARMKVQTPYDSVAQNLEAQLRAVVAERDSLRVNLQKLRLVAHDPLEDIVSVTLNCSNKSLEDIARLLGDAAGHAQPQGQLLTVDGRPPKTGKPLGMMAKVDALRRTMEEAVGELIKKAGPLTAMQVVRNKAKVDNVKGVPDHLLSQVLAEAERRIAEIDALPDIGVPPGQRKPKAKLPPLDSRPMPTRDAMMNMLGEVKQRFTSECAKAIIKDVGGVERLFEIPDDRVKAVYYAAKDHIHAFDDGDML